MDPLALTIKYVFYPAWVRKNHSARLRYLAELERTQFWSPERIRQLQFEKLRRLLRHARDTSPYYRASFEAAGFDPQRFESLEDMSRVPAITKEQIQENRDAMVSGSYRREELLADMTGGSTGSPMQFYYDRDRHDSREGASLRHDRWARWDIGLRRAVLWGAPQDTRVGGNRNARLREKYIERRMLLDASSLDEASMTSFAQQLQRYQPAVIQAYANTLGLFTQFVRSAGIRGIEPRAIITSAEVLTPETRRLAEETFGCRIYNRYGSREFGVVASECDVHDGMHINAENLYVEVLADGKPAQGVTGEIAVTDLSNLAMPMIRYRIRDTGLLKPGHCTCSRGLPLLELSGGRVTDFLTATSGAKVSGIVIATYVITNLPGIRQVQFWQRQAGSLEVKVVRSAAWKEATLAELRTRLARFLGDDMRLEFVFVENIPLEKSGKYRFSISSL